VILTLFYFIPPKFGKNTLFWDATEGREDLEA